MLTLESNVSSFDRIWVYETRRDKLEPRVVELMGRYRAGDVTPPMLSKLLTRK